MPPKWYLDESILFEVEEGIFYKIVVSECDNVEGPILIIPRRP